MKVSSRLSISPAITVGLSAAAVVVAIAIILLASNVTMAKAQQQQQVQQQPSLTSQPAVTQNGTTLFQNTEDSIRVQVPEGWAIQDVNNTGSVLSDEARLGYGILAQLCPQEEEEEEEQPQQQQRGAALSNVSG